MKITEIKIQELIDIDNAELSEGDYKERAAEAEVFYKRYFKKTLQAFLLGEYKYLGDLAENEQMLLFGRGHIDMLQKIDKWFQQQSGVIELNKEEGSTTANHEGGVIPLQ